MAPSTRLGARAHLRVDYSHRALKAQNGSPRSSSTLESSPPQAAASTKTKNKAATNKPVRDTNGRFTKANTTTKAKQERKKVVKVAAPPKPAKKVRPEKTECVICATTKDTKRCFRAPADGSTCIHFEGICTSCIQKQIKTKISARQLTDAHLPCMFPECNAVLNHTSLKKTLSKALFEYWDSSLMQHLLSSSPHYLACLNSTCGLYFSTENCHLPPEKASKRTKPRTQADCPHCDAAVCLLCTRTWHEGTNCNELRKQEEQATQETIEKMGAKGCPKCGVKIEKQGGCDHMACSRCHQNFCWECLAPLSHRDVHAEGCSHRRPIVQDRENFVAENLTVREVNRLIEDARRRREGGA
ncbi:hypothetical protein N0V94_008488 [Neodidymelliopsis sp. IMI 364377]|nr:hypothetical protein N0V94_008488 [Neodidymelliopsis sp. IMI 364377]